MFLCRLPPRDPPKDEIFWRKGNSPSFDRPFIPLLQHSWPVTSSPTRSHDLSSVLICDFLWRRSPLRFSSLFILRRLSLHFPSRPVFLNHEPVLWIDLFRQMTRFFRYTDNIVTNGRENCRPIQILWKYQKVFVCVAYIRVLSMGESLRGFFGEERDAWLTLKCFPFQISLATHFSQFIFTNEEVLLNDLQWRTYEWRGYTWFYDEV